MRVFKRLFHTPEQEPPIQLSDTVLFLILRQGNSGFSLHDMAELLGFTSEEDKANLNRVIGELLSADKIYVIQGTHIYFPYQDFLPNSQYLSSNDPLLSEMFAAESEFESAVSNLPLPELYVLYVAARGKGFRLMKDDKTEGRNFINELNEIAYEFVNPELAEDPIPMFSERNLPDQYVMSLNSKGFFKPHAVYGADKTSNTYRLKSIYLRTYLLREGPRLLWSAINNLSAES